MLPNLWLIVLLVVVVQQCHAVNPLRKRVNDDCQSIPVEKRLDCYPEIDSDQNKCESRGCCWLPASNSEGELSSTPWCFYSGSYKTTGYQITDSNSVNDTFKQLEATRKEPSFMPNDVTNIKIDISYETESRARVRMYDPANSRFEVPQQFVHRPVDGKYSAESAVQYSVETSENGTFGFSVKRSDGTVFLNSIADNFIFADQFLQVSFNVVGTKLYGLGEHRKNFMYNVSVGDRVAIWARDQSRAEGCNEYGAHPMYVMIEDDSRSHGVVLMNSNAQDITLQPGKIITWRTIGGVLDFYFLIGPSPKDVVRQYFDLIGRPLMPPYWSLGFHLCKYNYGSSEETWQVVNRTRAINFPQEVQWNDIDYMDSYLDFTYDKNNFASLPALVDDLHAHKQRYIMILDSGISDVIDNDAFTQGNKMNIWVNTSDAITPLEAKVWPGLVFFPDFTNTQIVDFWYGQLQQYHDIIPFDGIWIDMNEPSNFVDGSTSGCTQSTLDNPPYLPSICGGTLQSKTICGSALHEAGTHYDLHSLYGHTEGIASNKALKQLFPKKRPVIISRSTFMSSGRYVGHWTGDNGATWDDLKWSIPAVLNSNLFGITFTGADICGFNGDTTEELCTRWMQLGAFYTFMRNHNTINAKDQDPAVFSTTAQDTMRHYTLLRYRYLPYLYTEMFRSTQEGATVLTSLAFEFPDDSLTHPIQTQFMWGSAVMVVPVLTEGATSVTAYFPHNTKWYSLESPEDVYVGGQEYTIEAPLSQLPLFVRSGSILVTQQEEMYLDDSRKNELSLEIFAKDLDSNATDATLAEGWLFWDDGESELSLNQYTLINFTLSRISGKGSADNVFLLTSNVVNNGYSSVPKLGNIAIHGVDVSSQISVSAFSKQKGVYRTFNYNYQRKVSLNIRELEIDVLEPVELVMMVRSEGTK